MLLLKFRELRLFASVPFDLAGLTFSSLTGSTTVGTASFLGRKFRNGGMLAADRLGRKMQVQDCMYIDHSATMTRRGYLVSDSN